MKTSSHLNERHEETASKEILVKTEGGKSLRLNATKISAGHWEVTIPFEQPVIIVQKDGKWSLVEGTVIGAAFVQEIGAAIEEYT